MTQTINALVIHPSDTVAVALQDLQPGDAVVYQVDNELIRFTAQNAVPRYHKLAVKRVTKGDFVYKYGEIIGLATTDIEVGEHVHIHNVRSARESAPVSE